MIATKVCTNCKEEQPLTGFVRDAGRPDGIYPRCKKCTRNYYLENSSLIRAKSQEYREKNQESVRAAKKLYAIRRFFFLKAHSLKQRASGPSASFKELAQIWKFQRGVCPLSGRRLNRENSQLDHVIPVVRGGESTIDNLRWVHRDVNYAKRDLLDAEFIALCQDVVLANLAK